MILTSLWKDQIPFPNIVGLVVNDNRNLLKIRTGVAQLECDANY